MTIEVWFWLFYVLALLLGFYFEYVPGQPYPWRGGTRHFIFFILVGLLGLRVFGSPIKG